MIWVIFSVCLGVERGLREEDWVLLWCHSQLVVEGVVPDLLHVVPVGHDAVLDGVLEGEDASLGLGLVTHIAVLLTHTDHDTLMSWSADNRGEHGSWGIVASEASFAHSGPIVHDKGSNFVVTHFVLFFLS